MDRPAKVTTTRAGMLAELEAALAIDENALDDALIQQPQAFLDVARELTLTVSRRDGCKRQLEELEAEVDAKARHDAEVAGDKVTVREIEGIVALNPKVKAKHAELHQLNESAGLLQALKEAFQQRSYVLKSMCDLYIAGYFGDVSSSVTKDAKGFAASRNKAAMAEERQRVNKRR